MISKDTSIYKLLDNIVAGDALIYIQCTLNVFKIILSQYQGVAPGILNKVHRVKILWSIDSKKVIVASRVLWNTMRFL